MHKGKTVMKYCYLDHNIIIESLNNSSIDRAIRKLKDYVIDLENHKNKTIKPV